MPPLETSKPSEKDYESPGIVQGVGFRPFVWKRAHRLGLAGWVYNDSLGVTIEIEGNEVHLAEFLAEFSESIPPLARVDSLIATDVECVGEKGFFIRESLAIASDSTPISPDISICHECLQELFDGLDRRYLYPFINCTNCGPRFTIVEDIPYDRPLTTMKSFPMCDCCQQEYSEPVNRRFHAQPNACPDCGPAVWFVAGAKDVEAFESRPHVQSDHQDAIRSFHEAIESGGIVAIKGIGGFHLACDATNSSAVARLRERKGHINKPFALMVHDVEQAASFAVIGPQERSLLESQQRPIVLLQKRYLDMGECAADQREVLPTSLVGFPAAELAAPGNNFVGVMLPYSPLHYLLSGTRPLVMTSGNISDEPIVRTNVEARKRLERIADFFLLHDREIEVVCDDSIVRCLDGALLPIRRSRGYAPMPIKLVDVGPSVLAVGGEIKSAFCVAKDDYVYMSQHIGDMGNQETLEAMRRSVEHFLRIFRVDVAAVAADLHPGYLSGQWAEQFANSLGVPLIRIQHHFAHVVSLLGENCLPFEQKIIGCCFDGTGYGTDEAIWGGEFMIADTQGFQRIAHLQYSPLPGGDSSIRRPYRMALALLWASGLTWNNDLPCVAACPERERKLLHRQLERNLNCISTSSMGRLFDAVASIIGVRQEVSYEAQAAMEMEALAAVEVDEVDPSAYRFSVNISAQVGNWSIDPGSLLAQICNDVVSGVPRSRIAAQFHHAVVNLVLEVCQLARQHRQLHKVGLTGGVFQNVLLLQLTQKRLRQDRFEVLSHSQVPPNDGGIALGQAICARRRIHVPS